MVFFIFLLVRAHFFIFGLFTFLLVRHVDEGHGEQPALIWDSPITGSKDTVTYAQLQDKVARLAGVLAREGVGRGDRVLIYMPMVTEAVIAMLATVRLGAAHSVVFGGFAAKELAVRIRHAEPKVIISTSCGVFLKVFIL